METFQVTIQSPLTASPLDAGVLDAKDSFMQFAAIDWLQWARVYADPAYGDSLSAFYFFEAKRSGTKHLEPLLCLSGQGQTVHEIELHGPRFKLIYFFLEKSISKGFLGFGAGKERTELSQRTMRDCSLDFSKQCLEAFLRGDLEQLDQQIQDNDFEDSE